MSRQKDYFLSPRKCHGCCITDRYMIVHGGLDSEDTTLSDLWMFDLVTKSWSELTSRGNETALSHHRMVTAVEFPERYANIFKAKKHQYFGGAPLFLEGIYSFGGKDSTHRATNSLYCLRLGRAILSFKKMETLGQKPAARYGHCLHYYRQRRSLVVYGGRNDDLFQTRQTSVLGDVFFLNLVNLSWITVTLSSGLPKSKYNFSSSIVGK